MGGAALASQLRECDEHQAGCGVRFELATAVHDAPLRRLLRENPMAGMIRLSLEREPSFFAAAAPEGSEHQTIVALEDQRVVAVGNISARQRFINGRPMRVGYLGALRLDAACRGRASILRRGYEFFRKLHEQGGPPIYLTSIIADNLSARRFLEKGLSGMPTYRYLGEFVTLIIRRRRRTDSFGPASRFRRGLREKGLQLVCGSDRRCAEIRELLAQDLRAYQFAPVWEESEIHPKTFQIACAEDGTPVACAAMWDQRAIKQSVVRGYSSGLRWARPLINVGAALLGRPRLPQIGMPVSYAFLSHLAASAEHPELAELLIHSFQAAARTLGVDYLTLGFDHRDARLAHLRQVFRPREYISRIYAVHWEDGAELAKSLDDRLQAPEVATL